MSSKRGEIKGEARMEERTGEAFAFDEQLTVVGSKLQPGGVAPDFLLDYLDLIGMTIQSARLADSTGMVRLLNVVNSLERPVCNRVTRRWEDLSAGFPAGVCLYTVSMDSPSHRLAGRLPKESCTSSSPRSGASSSGETTECCSRSGSCSSGRSL